MKKIKSGSGKSTRRKFIQQSGALLGGSLLTHHFFGKVLSAQSAHSLPTFSSSKIGEWTNALNGLPVYEYQGKLPFTAVDKEGKDALLPEDPFFIAGNYRCTLLTHVSGIFQWLTGERAWARINAANDINYGANSATISILNKQERQTFELVGLNSIAADPNITKRFFGTGFARYEYNINKQVECTRILSVKPSPAIHQGHSAFVITITLKNKAHKSIVLSLEEKIRMNYLPASQQEKKPSKRAVQYTNTMVSDNLQQTVLCNVSYTETAFLTAHQKEQNNIHDIDPASVFMHIQPQGGATVTCTSTREGEEALYASIRTQLKPGESKTFQIVLGLTYEKDFSLIKKQVQDLLGEAALHQSADGLFTNEWKKRLPDFTSETNAVFQREMLWNAYTLESMATYSKYFNETYVPQGMIYTYEDGENISNRDHAQAMLPLCYYNPALAKSALRYVMKHTSATGEIKRGTGGFGYVEPSVYKESDEQLYLFMAISEYLRITKDYDLLTETISYYPAEYQQTGSVIDFLMQYFVYLRDEVGRGKHGLVKILNSDWSDSFFHKYSPNLYAQFAESLLNTTMALAVLPPLIDQLQKAGSTVSLPFIKALQTYNEELSAAFLKDFGSRNFAARCYLNLGKEDLLGKDNVCIEPQGYLLQMKELSNERKNMIYQYVKAATCVPEKIGFRTREKPLWGGKGEGEDGGIWFSLEGPVIIGVSTFDKKEAWALLEKMSFNNFAVHYPHYWVGHWTLPDNVNSSLSAREGLYAYWQDTKKAVQGFCSHPHSWPLYCYFKLKE